MPIEYVQFTQFWEKVQFRSYDDYLDQSYYILKKLEWYRQAEEEGRDRKEKMSK